MPKNDVSTTPPKRKRGRPKGSKNRKILLPDPDENPYVEPIDWSDGSLRAPNGLPGSGPADFLQELVPILAAQEMNKYKTPDPDEEAVRDLIRETMTHISSNHRTSARLENLRPYSSRPDPIQCDACKGEGMTVCSFCAGEGFCDFGEGAHLFHERFDKDEMILPKHVMGNMYHCPYCGGLQQERCVKCLGVGVLQDENAERLAGAARKPIKDDMWRALDMDEILDEDPDRIEVGLDGLVIMRAKTRKRSGKKASVLKDSRSGAAAKDGMTADAVGDSEADQPVVEKPKRGRPRKKRAIPNLELINTDGEVGDDGVEATIKRGKVRATSKRVNGPSTDFLNITDYQLGRKLQKQKIIPANVEVDGVDENISVDSSSE